MTRSRKCGAGLLSYELMLACVVLWSTSGLLQGEHSEHQPMGNDCDNGWTPAWQWPGNATSRSHMPSSASLHRIQEEPTRK